MKSSSVALVVAVLALIVGGGLYFYSEEDDLSDQQIYEDGIKYQEEIDDSLEDNQDEVLLASPDKINLVQVSKIEGSAIANRVYSGKEFIHTIVAELPALDEGYYGGWLVRKIEGQSEIISTGKLIRNDGSFYLEYRSDNDKSSHNQVIITLELEDDDLPEEHIFEGIF